MNSIKLRKRSPISYFEIDEPDPDEYLYCETCRDYVYEYCSIHGPLLVVPDDKVPAKTNLPSYVPRAALTIPHVFLHIAHSIIPGAGLGVFSTLTLPRGVRFGPYLGEKTMEVDSSYCWQLYDRNNKPCHAVDAVDANKSNWMRYVNCARHCSEQNLVAYQYQGQLYYRYVVDANKSNWMRYVNCARHCSEQNLVAYQYQGQLYYRYVVDAYKSNWMRYVNCARHCSEQNLVAYQYQGQLYYRYVVDANKSNWMRYVNCARHCSEQNLVAYQYQGQLYYRYVVDANKSNWMRYVNCARHCSEQNLVAYQYQGQLYYRYVVDANKSNWMRYVNCARHCSEQNLVAYQYQGQLYYRYVVDANKSNWMRYVNCARHCSKQNLVAYQYQGLLYYRTIKIIPRFTELMVYYGSEFANTLRIDLRNYNSPFGFVPIWGPDTRISNEAKNEKCVQSTLEATFADEEFIFIEAPPKMETSIDEDLEIRTVGSLPTVRISKSTITIDNGQEATTDINNIEDNSKKENLNTKSILNSPIVGEKKESFVCDQCSKTFTSKDSIIKHIKEHNKTMQDMFKKCNECNFQTISDYSLQNHLKFHDKSRPYECENCKYRFRSRSTFKKHVEIHIKVYRSCQYCNFKTIRLRSLNSHLSKHTEPIYTAYKPKRNPKTQKHVCNICEFKTHRLDSLKKHILRHAGLSSTSHLAKRVLSITVRGKKHVCETCDYKTEKPSSLRRHLKTHEGHIASMKCN